MLIFTKIADLQQFLKTTPALSRGIGFVPTMGALHAGHLSLIRRSKAENDLTVCSVFVNPTQFNDAGDLARYPRTPDNDIALLESAACDVLFMPGQAEMYPEITKESFDFGGLGAVLEGAARPGHFNGVAQVVKMLFNIVKPDRAYFGRKDYQQLLIVTRLVEQMKFPVSIVACETEREPDGLAMSSRNRLLAEHERTAAAIIPKAMAEARQIALTRGIPAAVQFVESTIAANPMLQLEYFVIAHPQTLQPVTEVNAGEPAISLIAVRLGSVRLIDNLEIA